MLPSFTEDPELWNSIAQNPLASVLARLASNNRCPWCRYREPDGWLTRHPGQIVPLEELLQPLLWHMKSTHGHDPAEVLEQLRELTVARSTPCIADT
jgi:hypothetical protein